MRRNILSMAALAVAAAFTLTSCLSDGDDTIVLEDGNTTGIPGDDQAGPNPTIDNQTTTIPNITTTLEGDGSTAIARIDMTGVQEGGGYDWLRLVGTGQGGQNVWVEVDGKPKGIAVVNNADNEGSQTMPKIDLVFCVDNSGSMSEEADAIARDIVNWANLLQNSSLDIRFGCVGYSMWGEISGAINMTDANTISTAQPAQAAPWGSPALTPTSLRLPPTRWEARATSAAGRP